MWEERWSPRWGWRGVGLAALALGALAALVWLLALRRQLLLPEAALVQADSAAFLAYTIREQDTELAVELLQLADLDGPSERSGWQLEPGRLRPFLPLRLIAVLGPARRAERAWLIALSTSRTLPLARRALARSARAIGSYHGWSILAPTGVPGYLSWGSNRWLWASDRRALRGAIDALAARGPAALPARFGALGGDEPHGAAGAFYLVNDGGPFSFSAGERGDTRFQLPADFRGLSFHFDLVTGGSLVGRGRLQFEPDADTAAQGGALRALLDAAAQQHRGRLRYRVEPAGASQLDLTLRWSGLQRPLSEALRRALEPLRAPAAAAG